MNRIGCAGAGGSRSSTRQRRFCISAVEGAGRGRGAQSGGAVGGHRRRAAGPQPAVAEWPRAAATPRRRNGGPSPRTRRTSWSPHPNRWRSHFQGAAHPVHGAHRSWTRSMPSPAPTWGASALSLPDMLTADPHSASDCQPRCVRPRPRHGRRPRAVTIADVQSRPAMAQVVEGEQMPIRRSREPVVWRRWVRDRPGSLPSAGSRRP